MTAEKLLSNIFTSKKKNLFAPKCITFHNRIALISLNKCDDSYNRPTWKIEISLDTMGHADKYEVFRVKIYDSVSGSHISSNSFPFSEYLDRPTDSRISKFHIWKYAGGYEWYIEAPHSSIGKLIDAIQGYIEGVAS